MSTTMLLKALLKIRRELEPKHFPFYSFVAYPIPGIILRVILISKGLIFVNYQNAGIADTLRFSFLMLLESIGLRAPTNAFVEFGNRQRIIPNI